MAGQSESVAMKIDIYSDVICPWCYIGKRRLDAVLASPVGEGVTLRWRPYQLYPNLPPNGMLRESFLIARNPGASDLQALRARIPGRIRTEAADVGLRFDFAAIEYMPNTRLAHRVLEFAFPYDLQHELAEVLFRYYFCEGRNVGDPTVLVAAAKEVGLDGADIEALVAGDEGVDELQQELDRGIELGISGVPCYLLGGSFMLPGAQTTDVIEKFIARAKQRLVEIG